ncbi:uncharacterized protein LOC130673872 [Microplitis mediator]|uniref:uncharacterized protein LOC130673872 n=1 Tax=Microplitis mediator TaxID=375433 RepID=UPI0025542C2A|nr:uncharacterized protein LOC130673872 [Microplitis mediator]
MHQGQSARIERVQRRFLKFLIWKKTGQYPPRGVTDLALCTECSYPTLEERCICNEFAFATKLFNNLIDCPQLLLMFRFKVPFPGLRNHAPMHMPSATINLAQSTPLYRMSKTANRFCAMEESLDPLDCPTGYVAASLANLIAKWR